jgi:hypothetical protein
MYLALAILMLVAIACGSPEPVEPTPTPDVPSFAKGEARALVRADMIGKIGNRNYALECDESIKNARTEVIYETSTTASYLGQQVWSVKSNPFTSPGFGSDGRPGDSGTTTLDWKVYEFSGVVEPASYITVFAMEYGC